MKEHVFTDKAPAPIGPYSQGIKVGSMYFFSGVIPLSADDFSAMNAVYAEFFGDSKPARSTVEVSRLPKDVLVEIEMIASQS